MTACTQPGCTGTIVDGYCDVCGSPVGAVPFVPTEAAAPAGSPARADEPGLTAVGPGSGFPLKPKNAGLETACTQPGCTGMIVDGYCDVCGSPAGAAPLVPAKTAASALDEEMPIQRIPRPTQQLSTQEMADPVAADPAAVDAKKVDREKELAENETDGAQDYRTRVEEAQLPDDVREAALREVGKLERTSDQSPESDDIRNWLDTMLDLPWSTKIIDSIDIQGSREVEATLQGLIKPVVADSEEGDTPKVDPVAADTDKADTAPAGPHDDDTLEIAPVVPVVSGGRHRLPQLPEQQEKLDPAVADAEQVDAVEVDPAVADTEQVDAVEVDPAAASDCTRPGCTGTIVDGYCDVCGSPAGAAPLVLAGTAASAASPRPAVAPDLTAVSAPAPARVARPGLTAVRRGVLVAAVFFVVGCAVVLYQVAPGFLTFGSRPSPTASSAPTTVGAVSASPGGVSSSIDRSPASDPRNGSAQGEAIQLEDLPNSARPFETVPIEGTYRGGADTFLRVQRWEGGNWLTFPVPAKTDQSGMFTAYVELGPGRYQLRVVHLGSGVTSKPFVLVIKG